MNWAAYIGLFIGEATITAYLLYEVSMYKCQKCEPRHSFLTQDVRQLASRWRKR